MAGTTPKSRALGARMRTARDAVTPKISVRGLAEKLNISHATVSRWETGERAPRPEDVSAYMVAIDAPADLRDELVEMSRDTSSSHWLSVGMPEQSGQLAALLEIERTASVITQVSPMLVPGLLQTGDYARAVMIATEMPADQIETRVAIRVGRSEVLLRRRNPARLRAFLWEPVLHELIGGEDVMADQLQHLLDMAQRENVDVRVIPTRTEFHPALEGPFSIAEFTEPGRAPVVHLENKISGLFLHELDEVGPYERAVRRVEEVAISSEASAELIASVINSEETTR